MSRLYIIIGVCVGATVVVALIVTFLCIRRARANVMAGAGAVGANPQPFSLPIATTPFMSFTSRRADDRRLSSNSLLIISSRHHSSSSLCYSGQSLQPVAQELIGPMPAVPDDHTSSVTLPFSAEEPLRGNHPLSRAHSHYTDALADLEASARLDPGRSDSPVSGIHSETYSLASSEYIAVAI
ncbi:hypothetical protein BV22DRAFT_226169 [Leucogyrophana mollusca]|uniref:Uncharacterized protein n=1 Tax=Leucogyrophana mollusca TaxID=85980 RepID=A0ACB8BRX7_9AGAM|nr:hypothetical protein BV22DRAFT_226169 [Leucogyrophana mollusca]